ncbi:molybdopterin-dependent oxidoreductase [Halobacteriovorax sp. JY17]|uniref:molybdopterin-dependent oxidoreductase n=1 Tax=Halobacteriovorax sp. JY17 TaxID=2014617 RepID=UPI000C55FA75|nr:molybdopterin-dependent oxidoreductase [Halobacteriovorax sp. JY17]PIK16157.1 MAG: hypothetical protein CES88_05330 [Halobacteriovorax sp. JY17]
MKHLISIILLLFSINIYSINYSKQKVFIGGNVKAPKTYTIEEISKLPQSTADIHDPYSKNKKVRFQGILLADLFKIHANKNSKRIEIIAINDYKVTIDRSFIEKEKMLLAIKGDGSFLTVKEKGPARIVVPGKGELKEGKLAKEGVNWVWFVRSINFL